MFNLQDHHFKEIAESKPDSKNRVTLGKHSVKAHHYKIYENESGQIILDPQVSVPASEVWLFKNKKALASVAKGLSEAKQGKLTKAPENYTIYIDDENQ